MNQKPFNYKKEKGCIKLKLLTVSLIQPLFWIYNYSTFNYLKIAKSDII